MLTTLSAKLQEVTKSPYLCRSMICQSVYIWGDIAVPLVLSQGQKGSYSCFCLCAEYCTTVWQTIRQSNEFFNLFMHFICRRMLWCHQSVEYQKALNWKHADGMNVHELFFMCMWQQCTRSMATIHSAPIWRASSGRISPPSLSGIWWSTFSLCWQSKALHSNMPNTPLPCSFLYWEKFKR